MLRNYQIKAVEKIIEIVNDKNENRGIVVIPTGGGKTLIKAKALDNIISNKSCNKTRIFSIVAPRISLAIQHMYSFNDYKKNNGFNIENEYIPYCLHSGGTGDTSDEEHYININKISFDVNSGTSVWSLKEEIKRAKKENLDLLVFSTYHSFDRLIELKNLVDDDVYFHTCFFDECHHMVGQKNCFSIFLKNTPFENNFFFTATRIYSNSNSGRDFSSMDNRELWGDNIFIIKPIDIIRKGFIVRPRLNEMIVNFDENEVKDEFMKNLKIIKESYKLSKEIFSQHDENMPVKIIYNTDSVDTILKIKNMAQNQKIVDTDEVCLYGISSKEGAWIYENKTIRNNVERKEWLKEIKDQKKDCLIFHFDIISEGIDISGINATVIMRNVSKTKALQQIGRTLRVYEKDRIKLNNNEININDYKGWSKPFGLVIVPILNDESFNNSENNESIKSLVEMLREEGFDDVYIKKSKDERGNSINDDNTVELSDDIREININTFFDEELFTIENNLEDLQKIFSKLAK